VELEAERTEAYRKDATAESVLQAMNERLADLERALVAPFEAPSHPTIFIVGAPRSGTTLLLQLLLGRYEFGYVDNFVARFWMAPYVGSILARQALRDLPWNGVELKSDFGATQGPRGPHEFGYFWRRWFEYGETHDLPATRVHTQGAGMLRKELAALESIYGRPMLLKNLVCSFHIDFLASALPRSIFLHCRREPVYAAQSVLQARLAYHGHRDAWFSVKPAAYPELRQLPYPEQIAGQIYATRAAVERQFSRLPSVRALVVDYEDLCAATERELGRIAAWIGANGTPPAQRSHPLPDLAAANRRQIPAAEFEALERACEKFGAIAWGEWPTV
jgi:hypothetical protein